jgi:TolB-like protein
MDKAMDRDKKARRQKVYLILGILAGLLAGAAGCQKWQHLPGLTDPTIQVGPPENFVTTSDYTLARKSIAILPFRVPTQVTDVSYSITEVFYRQLLEQRPFLGVIRGTEYYGNLAEARKMAKTLGADLFVMGEVPYFLDSGATGRSGIQIDLKVVETATGHTLWYKSDNIMAEPAPIIDLWVTETKPKPGPSVYYLVDNLSKRMCKAMLKDIQPPVEQAANSGNKSAAQNKSNKSLCSSTPCPPN